MRADVRWTQPLLVFIGLSIHRLFNVGRFSGDRIILSVTTSHHFIRRRFSVIRLTAGLVQA